MFSKITKFVTSTQRSDVLFKVLLLLTAIFVYLIIGRRKRLFSSSTAAEGFAQQDAFVFKRGPDAFDEFYVQVHDHLFQTEHRVPFEIEALESTQPDKTHAIILDAACGSGCLVSELTKKGYSFSYGVDTNPAFVQLSREQHPEAKTKLADIADPMAFDPSTFTHILLPHFAIYRHQDKRRVFSNLSTWMVPQGYLLLHLVDPAKFDPVSPAAKSDLVKTQIYSERLTDTMIEYDGFTYKCGYDFARLPEVTFTETFTDAATKHVRQNEHVMWMDPVSTVISMAKDYGFAAVGKMELKGDTHQWVYILQRGNI